MGGSGMTTYYAHPPVDRFTQSPYVTGRLRQVAEYLERYPGLAVPDDELLAYLFLELEPTPQQRANLRKIVSRLRMVGERVGVRAKIGRIYDGVGYRYIPPDHDFF